MKSKKAKIERFEELEFEECDFEWSTIVDNGIQKNKNPKIQKKIEGIRCKRNSQRCKKMRKG